MACLVVGKGNSRCVIIRFVSKMVKCYFYKIKLYKKASGGNSMLCPWYTLRAN